MEGYSVNELRRIISPIAREYGVESVSLFGSHARGTATSSSDVDLKIVKGRLRSLFQLSGFRLAVEDALGRVLADVQVSCPPAVPIAVCGEALTAQALAAFRYYGVERVWVVRR